MKRAEIGQRPWFWLQALKFNSGDQVSDPLLAREPGKVEFSRPDTYRGEPKFPQISHYQLSGDIELFDLKTVRSVVIGGRQEEWRK